MANPYKTPAAPPKRKRTGGSESKRVITGQKLLIYGILGYFAGGLIMVSANAFLEGTTEKPVTTTMFAVVLSLGLIAILCAAICAAMGILRMGKVLFPGSTRFIYAIGVVLPAPFVGLIVMFVANSKANKFLKARGVDLGLLGAKRPK